MHTANIYLTTIYEYKIKSDNNIYTHQQINLNHPLSFNFTLIGFIYRLA